ncbi:MAG: DUF1624 domain-containing protein [Coriobacteriaceae bacterium]|nr:MAG: DUF1624 domain-containing protein [Coriobacteriaceae bacterium]
MGGTSLQPDSIASAAPAPTHTGSRLQYIDIAKGIAILAVIIGHVAIRMEGLSYGASVVTASCFTFHMPLFFLLSGYFLHYQNQFNWKREARRLLLPYVIAALAIVVLEALTTFFLRDQPQGTSLRHYIWEWFNAAIYGSAEMTDKELWPQAFRIGAIWFLLALFWARFLVTAAYKSRHSGLIVLILALIGDISARNVYLPFSIQAGMTASVYVYLGTLARRHDAMNYLRDHKLMLIPALMVWLYAIMHYNGFSMGTADFGAAPLDIARNIIGSLGGMVSILILSMYIEQDGHWISSHLAEIGRISLLVLVAHIIDDDVIWKGTINMLILASGLGAFKLVIIESIVRCSYTVSLAFMASRSRVIRSLFSLR